MGPIDISPLRDFVRGMTDLADRHHGDEGAMIDGTKPLLAKLIARDGWLPEEYTVEGDTYRQYLLHCDPQQRCALAPRRWAAHGSRTLRRPAER